MRRRRMMTIATTVLVAVIALAGTAAGASNDKARPFKGDFEGVFAIVADGDWCDPESGTDPVFMEGSGQSTHLGHFTFEARHCADLDAGIYTNGVGVLVAANGDELWATYDGQFLPLPDGTIGVTGTHTYDGGTGRFTNASGSADVPASVLFTSETEGPIWGTIDGTLAYDASDRRN